MTTRRHAGDEGSPSSGFAHVTHTVTDEKKAGRSFYSEKGPFTSSVTTASPSDSFLFSNSTKHNKKPSRSSTSPSREKSSGSNPTASHQWGKLGGGLTHLENGEGRVLLGLLLLGSVVRFWHLERPGSVVFDEVHFGGFANKYIQSRFFMDVHPPLAKLLITLMAFLWGFEGGSFDFKEIGREYAPDHVPYIAMRSVPATLGLLLIPLAYLTLRGLQTRPTTALLGALFIMFENGLITQSRFILLDSPLIFFTALTTFFWVGFSNENAVQRDRTGAVGPFSRRWWAWLTLTGLALGAVVSCKWVGLFTIATIGFLTLAQLWNLLGDLRVPLPLLFRHFLARAICLIALPIAFYMSIFSIHFVILSNSGEGDGFMSSEFQHTLIGHGMEDTFADVMVGSHVTLRHLNTQGGYLHSHPHSYPGGSKQQQVTLYPHRDDNNIWHMLNTSITNVQMSSNPDIFSSPNFIFDRQLVVLNHISTNKKLHSHDIRAPITEVDYQNEVSAYGFEGFDGDANDQWQIEIDSLMTDTSSSSDAKKRVQAVRTRFRLRHLLTGCYLFSHKVKLPDWGFEQQEVTCNKNPSKENSLWFIETNTHDALSSTAAKVNYRRPGFFAKFFELQAVMWQTNAGLTDRHAYDSRPRSWPTLRRGINFWVKDHRQIYLIGNPFVWWSSTLAIVAYLAARGLLILRAQRGYHDFNHSKVVHYDQLCGFLALGWALHYFPFFLMSRQLFLHHYFPALYFAILLLASMFDLATSSLKPKIRLQVLGVVLLMTIWSYLYFSPLTYAGVWTRSQCERAQWLPRWDFSCGDFLESRSDYALPKKEGPELSPTHAGGGELKQLLIEPGQNAFGAIAEKAPMSNDLPQPSQDQLVPPEQQQQYQNQNEQQEDWEKINMEGNPAAGVRKEEVALGGGVTTDIAPEDQQPKDYKPAVPAVPEATNELPLAGIVGVVNPNQDGMAPAAAAQEGAAPGDDSEGGRKKEEMPRNAQEKKEADLRKLENDGHGFIARVRKEMEEREKALVEAKRTAAQDDAKEKLDGGHDHEHFGFIAQVKKEIAERKMLLAQVEAEDKDTANGVRAVEAMMAGKQLRPAAAEAKAPSRDLGFAARIKQEMLAREKLLSEAKHLAEEEAKHGNEPHGFVQRVKQEMAARQKLLADTRRLQQEEETHNHEHGFAAQIKKEMAAREKVLADARRLQAADGARREGDRPAQAPLHGFADQIKKEMAAREQLLADAKRLQAEEDGHEHKHGLAAAIKKEMAARVKQLADAQKAREDHEASDENEQGHAFIERVQAGVDEIHDQDVAKVKFVDNDNDEEVMLHRELEAENGDGLPQMVEIGDSADDFDVDIHDET